jgi:hypothetical protein
MTRSRSLFAALLLTIALAVPAFAMVPSPATSYVDPCLRVCPAGDMNFHVVVRDPASNPVANSTVMIDLCACPGVVLCPPIGNEGYSIFNGCQVVAFTSVSGFADFQLRAGGTCSGGPVNVYADGVLLATLTAVSSPDQNGDASVTATDQGILAATKMNGPYDRTADFNCSAGLDPGDQLILDSHLGHSCAAVVPTRPSSWGRVKTIYR